MSGGGGGGGQNVSTQTSGPPQQFLDAYSNVLQRAQGVANQPYVQYPGNLVAGLSPDQQAGISGVQNAQGIANPYINAAAQYIGNSQSPLQPSYQPYANLAQSNFAAAPSALMNGQNAANYWLGSAANSANAGQQQSGALFNQMPGVASNRSDAANQWFGNAVGAATNGQNAANAWFNLAGRQLQPTQFSAQELAKYESPYTRQVVNATQAQFDNQNRQQQAALSGNAISNGAFGGDRASVAQGIAANQQQLAQAPVIAGLQNQGYAQALQEFNQQQQTGLSAQQASQQLQQGVGQGVLSGAGQLANFYGQTGQGILAGTQQLLNAYGQAGQGVLAGYGQLAGTQQGIAQGNLASAQQLANAYGQAGQGYAGLGGQALGAAEAQNWLASQGAAGMSNLGNQAQNTAFQGANALMGAGGLEQQVAQENLNVPYGQFQAQQAYPFQTTSFLSNIAQGLGGSAGGRSQTSSPGPNGFSQAAGLGIAGLGLANQLGAFGGGGGGLGSGFVDSGTFDTGAGAADALDTFFRRGGAVPRVGGGFVPVPDMPPDVSVGYIPGAGPFGVQAGGGKSNLLNPSMQNTTTMSSGSGGSGSGFNATSLIGPAIMAAAAFLADGGKVPSGIVGFPANRARMPGTGRGIVSNDNHMPHLEAPRLAAGGINIPMLPTNGQGTFIHGPGGVDIPQLSPPAPAGGGMDAVNSYLDASKAPPPAPISFAPPAGIVPPPAPPAHPAHPALSPEVRDFLAAFGSNSEGGGASEGVGGGGGPGGVGAEAAGGGSNNDSSGAGGSGGFAARGGAIRRADAGYIPDDILDPDQTVQSEPPPRGIIGTGPPPPPASNGIMPAGLAPPQAAPSPPGPMPGAIGGAGGDNSDTTAPAPQYQDHGRSHIGETLLAAGLGIMGGSSPFAGVNIGRGGLQGLQFGEQARLRDEQADLRRMQAEDLALNRRVLQGVAQQKANTGDVKANAYAQNAESRNAVDMARSAYYDMRTKAGPHTTQGDLLASTAQALQQQINPDTGKPWTAPEAFTHLKGIDVQQMKAETQLGSAMSRTADQQQARQLQQQAFGLREKAFGLAQSQHDQKAAQHDQDMVQRASDHDMSSAVSLVNNGNAKDVLDGLKKVKAGRGLQQQAAPAAVTPMSALPLPATAADAVPGKIYQTSRGPAKWDGQQFLPVQ